MRAASQMRGSSACVMPPTPPTPSACVGVATVKILSWYSATRWVRMYLTVSSISSSETQQPCARLGFLPRSLTNMSPLPRSCSAPFWSKIMREFKELSTESATRLSMFARIRPVTTSAEGRWVATIRWIPAARPSWAIRTIEDSTSLPATIIRSASSSITMTKYGMCFGGFSMSAYLSPSTFLL